MDKGVWSRIFKDYISDYNAIDKLRTDNIIEDEEVNRLNNKLLADIIVTFESEVEE